ncbi:MAG: extracellular solute-binding protein [Arenicellales bacterium]|nr:extracellular solute-binding protein [Arenicellales bacterium]
MKRILFFVSITILCTFGASAADESDLTVVSWGGVYTLSQQKAYGETWEKTTGKTIRWFEYNGGLGEIRAQVNSGKVTWDVVDVFPTDARTGCTEGLFEKIPRERFSPATDGTSITDDMMVSFPNDCVAPNILWSWVVFYDNTKFSGTQPQSIQDLFDLDKYPGGRAISVFPQANIEMALMADGVKPADVYSVMDTKEGIDRAFRKLDSIKQDLYFWSTGAEPIDLIESGKVVLATAYNGRVSDKIMTTGSPYTIIWDGQVLEAEWFAVIRGSKNRSDAIDFLVHATAPEQQAAQARWIPYGPMRRSALTIIADNEPWFNSGDPVMPHMPTRNEVMAGSLVANPVWWTTESGQEVAARYNDWVSSHSR